MAGRKPKKKSQPTARSRRASSGQSSSKSTSTSPGKSPSTSRGKGQGRGQGQGRSSGQGSGRRSGQGRSGAEPGAGAGGSGSRRGSASGSSGDRGVDSSADGAGRRRRRRPAKGLGGDQVEGRQAVRELLLAGKRHVSEVLMIEDLAGSDILSDIEDLSHEIGVTLRKISRRHMGSEALTESHQGVIARAAAVAEADFDRLMADPAAFLLVLDGITDPGNLGAILRTAECAGVTGVALGRHRSVHISPTVTKTAAGAVEHVPLVLVGGIPTAISQLNEAGVFTVGLDGGGDRSVFDLPQLKQGPTALVLGAEGAGLSRLVRERVSVVASIPLAGQLNSLNVATATAVACFEVVRARETQAD